MAAPGKYYFSTPTANGFVGSEQADYIDARVLGVATAEQHTVPAGANWVVFRATGDFWALCGANPTAAIPAADVTDGSASQLNPTVIFLNGAAKISLISAAAQTVSMMFFK